MVLSKDSSRMFQPMEQNLDELYNCMKVQYKYVEACRMQLCRHIGSSVNSLVTDNAIANLDMKICKKCTGIDCLKQMSTMGTLASYSKQDRPYHQMTSENVPQQHDGYLVAHDHPSAKQDNRVGRPEDETEERTSTKAKGVYQNQPWVKSVLPLQLAIRKQTCMENVRKIPQTPTPILCKDSTSLYPHTREYARRNEGQAPRYKDGVDTSVIEPPAMLTGDISTVPTRHIKSAERPSRLTTVTSAMPINCIKTTEPPARLTSVSAELPIHSIKTTKPPARLTTVTAAIPINCTQTTEPKARLTTVTAAIPIHCIHTTEPTVRLTTVNAEIQIHRTQTSKPPARLTTVTAEVPIHNIQTTEPPEMLITVTAARPIHSIQTSWSPTRVNENIVAVHGNHIQTSEYISTLTGDTEAVSVHKIQTTECMARLNDDTTAVPGLYTQTTENTWKLTTSIPIPNIQTFEPLARQTENISALPVNNTQTSDNTARLNVKPEAVQIDLIKNNEPHASVTGDTETVPALGIQTTVYKRRLTEDTLTVHEHHTQNKESLVMSVPVQNIVTSEYISMLIGGDTRTVDGHRIQIATGLCLLITVALALVYYKAGQRLSEHVYDIFIAVLAYVTCSLRLMHLYPPCV
ncbi:uncharacterized protein LOC127879688 isoform X2 [Dreissena polymorpha]|uniref:uncharacterized protein LOC127879688 isoform X2 n=1 Tax=Dreissena polymorpha TaxID=45954 RepID=UPI002264DBC1|nr:uncharacterized protein LOC127879688 isoform X2 [Dreissena polymorpha]